MARIDRIGKTTASDVGVVIVAEQDGFSDVMRRVRAFADGGARRILTVCLDTRDVLIWIVDDDGRMRGWEADMGSAFLAPDIPVRLLADAYSDTPVPCT